MRLMDEKNLDAVLVSNCSLGNLNTWLLAKEEMPLHLPYNRVNLCLVTREGNIFQYCSREPHPTDWGKFPLITESELPLSLQDGRLGLVNPSYLKKSVHDYIKDSCPGVEFVDVDYEFHLLKSEKCQEEVEGVETAARLFDRVFGTVPLILTGGPLEREVALRLRNRFREMDAECEDLMSSTMITLTSAPDGENSVEEPIPYPGRRIVYGDRVNLLVNGFMPGGFASALGRTCVLGEASEEAKRYWDLTVSLQQMIAEHAKPGVTIRDLTRMLTQKIAEHEELQPYGGNQIYGIGAAVYEAPRNIDITRDVELKENMTIVIAPRVCPKGKDPYCCMDTFVIMKSGANRLNRTDRKLRVLD